MMTHAHPRSSAIRRFLAAQSSAGLVLMAAAGVALVIANSPLAPGYASLLHAAIGPLSLEHWINDGLMALFFLLVGLEIKREVLDGQLSTWSRRILPGIAAAGGMIVPALIYLAFNRGPTAAGWAIPAATDIAFAVGVMALLGKRVPAALKLFLTTLAIVDDMGAVAIIALVYSRGLEWGALAAAAGVLAVMAASGRRTERRLWPFLLGFALVWLLVLRSGVHATVAGVLAALVVPITVSPGAPDDAASPLHRLEHALSPWVAFAIVPLFAFANAGIALGGVGWETLTHPLVLGIAAGLFVGKQAGIAGAIWLAGRFGIGRPGGAPWRQVYGVALLAGIGFTMSFFIGQLAFPDDPVLADEVKLGVLLGSLLAAVSGYLVLRFAPVRSTACAASSPQPS